MTTLSKSQEAFRAMQQEAQRSPLQARIEAERVKKELTAERMTFADTSRTATVTLADMLRSR